MIKRLKIVYSTLRSLSSGLYQSVATVIAELVSNAWDANATRVDIRITNDEIIIIDNGHGMNDLDFEKKFLEVGFSRRDENGSKSEFQKRMVMGRKGIGKLSVIALAGKAIIITKREKNDITGGILDAKKLEESSKNSGVYDVEEIGQLEKNIFNQYLKNKGTIIILKDLNSNLRKNKDFIKARMALYFQVKGELNKNDKFEIYVNKEICDENSVELFKKAQFLWYFDDDSKNEIIDKINLGLLENEGGVNMIKLPNFEFNDNGIVKEISFKGYIFSSFTTTELKIKDLEINLNKVSIFAHGRRRLEDINSIVENDGVVKNYLVGNIHINGLDEGDLDRFTTNREGIQQYDPLYKAVIEHLKEVYKSISTEWNKNRKKIKQSNSGNKKPEKIDNYINLMAKDIVDNIRELNKKEKNDFLKSDFLSQTLYNIRDLQEAFTKICITENLMRDVYDEGDIELNSKETEKINIRDRDESASKSRRNVIGDIRLDEISYKYKLNIDQTGESLTRKIKKEIPIEIERNKCISSNFDSDYKDDIEKVRLIRNPVMHTTPITEYAKNVVGYASQNLILKIEKFKEYIIKQNEKLD